MNDYETQHRQEDNPVPAEGTNVTPPMRRAAEPPTPPTPAPKEKYPEGISFNWVPLVIAVMFCISGAVSDWDFYLTLAVVVIIHELGHVIIGKSFGCDIAEMQVFFFSFISYRPKQKPGGSSWRNITWSLGVLPWGGFTTFKARVSPVPGMYSREMGLTAASSPYINDKPAWQRLLISAGGVLFNFITFIVMYSALYFMTSPAWMNWFYYLAQLSLLLAVLNILPVYPLDGGSIMFTIYEMVTGKKPSAQFTKWCGYIGFIVIILFFWVFPEWLNKILGTVMGSFF